MHELYNHPHFLKVSLTGKVDLSALLEAQISLMGHPEYCDKNALWEFDEGSTCDFSYDVLFEMVRRIKDNFPIGAGKKERAAFVSKNGLHCGFMKLFCEEAGNQGVPFEMKPFMNHEEAVAWLVADSAI